MFIPPSPITTTSQESGSRFSDKSNPYGFFERLSESSECSISAVSSMSSITLDPALTTDDTSVSSDKTASPVPFNHDDVHANFINPYSKSAKTDVQDIFKPGTQHLDFETHFISISEKSRKIAVNHLLLATLNDQKEEEEDELNLEKLRDWYQKALTVNIEREIGEHLQIDALTSEPLSVSTDNRMSEIHKTLYGVSFGMGISGLVLLLIKECSNNNDNLEFPGLFLMLTGIVLSISTLGYKHCADNRNDSIEECRSQMSLPV